MLSGIVLEVEILRVIFEYQPNIFVIYCLSWVIFEIGLTMSTATKLKGPTAVEINHPILEAHFQIVLSANFVFANDLVYASCYMLLVNLP